jgi:hypothetical protein
MRGRVVQRGNEGSGEEVEEEVEVIMVAEDDGPALIGTY